MPPKKRKSVAVPTGPTAAEVEATCQTLSKELTTEEAILMDTLRRLKADITHTAACVDAGEHEAAAARDAATRIDERLRTSLLRSERLVQGAERYKALQTAAVVAADRTVDAIYDDLDALKARAAAAAAGTSDESEGDENGNEASAEDVETAAEMEEVHAAASAEANCAAAESEDGAATAKASAPTTLGAALLLGGGAPLGNETAPSSSVGVGSAAAANKKKTAAASSPRQPAGSPFDSPRQQHAKDALFPPPIGADLPLSPTAAARDNTLLSHPERESRGSNAQVQEEDRLAAANVRYGRHMRALFAARQRQADTLKALLVRLRTMAQSVVLGAEGGTGTGGGADDSDTHNKLYNSKNNNQAHNHTNRSTRDVPTTTSTSTITLGDVSVDASNGGGIRGGDDVVVGGRLSDESFLYLPQQTWAVLRGLDRHLVDTVTAHRMHHHQQRALQSQPKLKTTSLHTHQHESEPSPSCASASDTYTSLKGAPFPSSPPPTAAATVMTVTDPSDLTQRWSQDVLLAANAAARATADTVTVTTTTTATTTKTTAAAVGATAAFPAAAATSSSSVSLIVVAPATPMLRLPPSAAATRAAVSNHNPQTNTAVHVAPELCAMLEEFLAPLSRSLSSAGGVSPMDFIASNRSPSSLSSSSCVQEARSAAVVACLPATAYQHAFNTETHGGHTASSSSSSAAVAVSALPSTMPTLPPWQQAADAAASSHATQQTAQFSAANNGCANGAGIPSACAVTVLSSVDEALGGVLAANIEAATAPPPPTTTAADGHRAWPDLLTASLPSEAAADVAAVTPSEHLSIVLVQGRVVPSTNAASGEDRGDEEDDVWITVGDAEDRIGGDAGAGAELLPPVADADGSGRTTSNATPPPPQQRHRQRQPFAAKPISLRALVDMACRAPAEALLATLQGRGGGDEMTTTASTATSSRRHLLLVLEVTGHIPPGSTATRDKREDKGAAADNDGCVVVAGPLIATRFHYRHRCWPLDSLDSQTTKATCTKGSCSSNAISMSGVCVAAVGLRLTFRAANIGLLTLLPPPPTTASPVLALLTARDHLERFVDAILDPLTTRSDQKEEQSLSEEPLLPLLAARTYVPPHWAEHRGVTTPDSSNNNNINKHDEAEIHSAVTTCAGGDWTLRHSLLVPSDVCVHVSAFMTASSLLLSSKQQQNEEEGDAGADNKTSDETADTDVPLLATQRQLDEERQGRIRDAFNVFLKDRHFTVGGSDNLFVVEDGHPHPAALSSPSTTLATVLSAGIASTTTITFGSSTHVAGISGVGFAGTMRAAVVQGQQQQEHPQEEDDLTVSSAAAAKRATAVQTPRKEALYFSIECVSSPTYSGVEKEEENEHAESETLADEAQRRSAAPFPLPHTRVLAQLAAEVQHYIRVNSGSNNTAAAGGRGVGGAESPHFPSVQLASSSVQPSAKRFFYYEDYDLVVIDVQKTQVEEEEHDANVEKASSAAAARGGDHGGEGTDDGVFIRTRVIAALVPSAVRRYASSDHHTGGNNTTVTTTSSRQLSSSSAAACHRRSRPFFHLQTLQQQHQSQSQTSIYSPGTGGAATTAACDPNNRSSGGYFASSSVGGGLRRQANDHHRHHHHHLESEGIRAFCKAFFANLQQQEEQHQEDSDKNNSCSTSWRYSELVPVEALIHLSSSNTTTSSSSSTSRPLHTSTKKDNGGSTPFEKALRVPSFALLAAPSLLSAEEKPSVSSVMMATTSSSVILNGGEKKDDKQQKRKKESGDNNDDVSLLLLKPRATVLPGGGVHRLGRRDQQYLAAPASSSSSLCMLFLLPSVSVEPPGGFGNAKAVNDVATRSLAAEVQQAWRAAIAAATHTHLPPMVPLMTTVADLLQPEGPLPEGAGAGAGAAESDAVRSLLKIAPDSVVEYLSTVAAAAHRAQSKASAVEGRDIRMNTTLTRSSLSSSIRILLFPLRASGGGHTSTTKSSNSSSSGLIANGSGGWVGAPSPPRPVMVLPAVGAPLAVVTRHAMTYYSSHQHIHSHNPNKPTTSPTTAVEAVEEASRLSLKVDAVSRWFTSIYL